MGPQGDRPKVVQGGEAKDGEGRGNAGGQMQNLKRLQAFVSFFCLRRNPAGHRMIRDFVVGITVVDSLVYFHQGKVKQATY